MKIFSVMPHLADQDFNAKKKLLLDVACRCNLVILFGSNSNKEDDVISSLEMLKSSDAVLVDLSFERPSCYFELGYAQAMEKPLILIAQAGTHIHQVLSRRSINTYSNFVEYELLIRKSFSSLSC
jgi:hypothetical protein